MSERKDTWGFGLDGIEIEANVTSEYRWQELGLILADEANAEQADMLCGLASGLAELNESEHAGLFQIQYIADAINADPQGFGSDDIKWFLGELLSRLDVKEPSDAR